MRSRTLGGIAAATLALMLGVGIPAAQADTSRWAPVVDKTCNGTEFYLQAHLTVHGRYTRADGYFVAVRSGPGVVRKVILRTYVGNKLVGTDSVSYTGSARYARIGGGIATRFAPWVATGRGSASVTVLTDRANACAGWSRL